MDPSRQTLVLLGTTDGWSYQPISTYGSFFMYWWDQFWQSMVRWVKSFHSVRLRLIISAYQYIWVDFSWPYGLVWTVRGTLSEVLPFCTVKADHISLSVRMGRLFMAWWTRLDSPLSTQAVRMADRTSLSVRTGHFSCTVGTSPDSPWSAELNPSIQYG